MVAAPFDIDDGGAAMDAPRSSSFVGEILDLSHYRPPLAHEVLEPSAAEMKSMTLDRAIPAVDRRHVLPRA